MHGLGLIVRLNQKTNQLTSVEDTFVLKVTGTNGQAKWLGLQKVAFLLV